MRGRLAQLALVVLCLVPSVAHARQAEHSDNVTLMGSYEFQGGSEIAFQDGRAYALQWGGPNPGVHILDPARGRPEQIGFIPCQSMGSEVQNVKPGVIAFDGGCAGAFGLQFVDVRNPKSPRFIGFTEIPNSIHTATSYPGKPIIYTSANGCCGDGEGGKEYIVDATDPRKPKVTDFTFYGIGCHDIAFSVSKGHALAACAGGSETQVWDVSDPLKPVSLARIFNGAFFHHSTAISSDGRLLAIGDEAHGVTTCGFGAPTGSLWIYDIEDPTLPVFEGYYGSSRGSPVSSYWATQKTWCTVHMYEFIPGTHIMTAAWWNGGMNVLDFSDPGNPTELAYYRAPDQNLWAAYWYEDRIWTADDNTHGVEVFEIAGLAKKVN